MGNGACAGDPRSMTSTATPVLPATLTLGPVSLTVSDLDRSVAWYQRALGLRVHAPRGDDRRRSATARATVVVLARGPAGAPRRPPRRPLPLRAALPDPRGARPRRDAAVGDADADPGRLRPRHPRGDLPARPRRQRHRARRRPPARAVAEPAWATPAARRRWTSTRCWPPSPARQPRQHVRPGPAHGPPAPARRRHRRRAWPSTATCSASRSRPTSAPPRSSPPAATTTTSASTSGAAAASGPRRSTPSGCATGPCVVPDTGEIRARVENAEAFPGGFLTRDPWGTAVAFVS